MTARGGIGLEVAWQVDPGTGNVAVQATQTAGPGMPASAGATLGITSNRPASATWPFGQGDAQIEFTLSLMIRPATAAGAPSQGLLLAEYPISSSEGARMVIASWPAPTPAA